jgi:hypothetical protein
LKRYAFRFLMALAMLASAAACGGKGGECAEPSDIAGVWELTATAISDSCSGLGSFTFPLPIAQDGKTLSGETPYYETVTGTVCGDRIQMSGTGMGKTREGTTTVDLKLTISVDGYSVEGSDTWKWTDGSQNCEGSNSLSGTRADDDVCDWGFTCPCTRPLDEYCEGSSCPTYGQAIAAAKEFDCDQSGFGCRSEAGQCGDVAYVWTGCNIDVDYRKYFDASGTLVAATACSDGGRGGCPGSGCIDFGFRPECELEQEQDFCDQND